MPRQIQLPTSQTPCTPVANAPTSYSLAVLLAAAITASGGAVARPTGGGYEAASFIFSNSGTGDAYLAWLTDLPAQQQTITVTLAADGTWTLLAELPRGKRPILLYESAANVMRGGNLNADGSIDYQGGSYVIESWFDGTTYAAKVRGSS